MTPAPASTFAVGDIHGHAAPLRRLLGRLRSMAETGDSLVFIGDYVDRGPESRQVVDLILEERGRWPGPVVTLKGNHEAMMLEALAGWRASRLVERQWVETADGGATIRSYAPCPSMESFEEHLPAAHREFFEGLALWHEDQHGIYVHAGIPPGHHPAECDEEDLLWIRDPFILSDYAWSKPVIFGHTPQFDSSRGEPTDLRQVRWQPLNRPEKIGIDTGCAYGGPLTAVLLPDRRFVDSNLSSPS